MSLLECPWLPVAREPEYLLLALSLSPPLPQSISFRGLASSPPGTGRQRQQHTTNKIRTHSYRRISQLIPRAVRSGVACLQADGSQPLYDFGFHMLDRADRSNDEQCQASARLASHARTSRTSSEKSQKAGKTSVTEHARLSGQEGRGPGDTCR